MNNLKFIEKAQELEKLPTLYKLGTFFNKKDGKYNLCDCSGLIKAIFWNYPTNGKYQSNGLKDMNANTMIKNCRNVSTNFKTILKGELLWMDGHIGIYIGNGYCCECSPVAENGVQITYVKGSGYANNKGVYARQWTKHGCFNLIDYTENTTEEVDYVTLQEAYKTIAKEVIKGTYGNGHDKRKEAIYEEVRKEVNKMT